MSPFKNKSKSLKIGGYESNFTKHRNLINISKSSRTYSKLSL